MVRKHFSCTSNCRSDSKVLCWPSRPRASVRSVLPISLSFTLSCVVSPLKAAHILPRYPKSQNIKDTRIITMCWREDETLTPLLMTSWCKPSHPRDTGYDVLQMFCFKCTHDYSFGRITGFSWTRQSEDNWGQIVLLEAWKHETGWCTDFYLKDFDATFWTSRLQKCG